MKPTLVLVLLFGLACGARAEPPAPAAPPRVPSAAEALAAWQAFREDPLARLDRTGPFLDFIRDSGAVHIVLNEKLLAWMYQPMDPARKATLYAAYLGGNMAEQLKNDKSSERDDVAGMESALDAYAALRKAHPDFSVPTFDSLARARAEQRLPAAIAELERDDVPPP